MNLGWLTEIYELDNIIFKHPVALNIT
jgi:hypothetical protein